MAGVRVAQTLRGVEEEQVLVPSVIGEPEVPHPVISESEHAYPFTPEEAMELMNARWNATNSARTGTVMIEA